MKIALVRPDYKPWWNRRRKWIPVYWPAHCDPELSTQAANPHYHIAWNRLPKNNSRAFDGSGIAGVVVWVSNVKKLKFPSQSPKIISKSIPVIDWKNNPPIAFPDAWKKLTAS